MIQYYRPKEISWLSFNHRVLQQAVRNDVPFYERIKFLGIYSSNLDEFFRVRVATLKRLAKIPKKANKIIGYDPSETLKRINAIVQEQSAVAEKAYQKILQQMKNYNVQIVTAKQLNKDDLLFVSGFFEEKVKSSLVPIFINKMSKAPDLVDDNIYFGVKYTNTKINEIQYSILQLPTHKFDRFIMLPQFGDTIKIMYLDDIIRLGLNELFVSFYPEDIKAFTFKITKDAELDFDDDVQSSYVDIIEESLKKRKKGRPVRFIYDKEMSKDLLDKLLRLFNISNVDAIISGGRYHNTKDLMHFPNVFGIDAHYQKIETVKKPVLEKQVSFFETLTHEDVFLNYPYHSFNYYLDFLREAAIDPNVYSIQITIYRLSKNSDVVNILLAALQNGKNVTAVIELQARFDESENISWSRTLGDAGAKVIYGVPGLKVHSKLTLVTRYVNKVKETYAAVGTGNFNESTARLYSDITILTAKKQITEEVEKVFEFLKSNYKHFTFRHLIVSPFNYRIEIKKLIRNEISNAKKGIKAFIYLKINNIDDREMINLLYEASQAGVDVVLLVRGMFSLLTQIKGVSERIKAYGIIDMFLEHSRFMIFGNNNNPKFYISSADMMVRNIDRRVEVTMPILDTKIKIILLNLFDIYRKDNVSARILDKKLRNKYNSKGHSNNRAQIEVYNFFKKNP